VKPGPVNLAEASGSTGRRARRALPAAPDDLDVVGGKLRVGGQERTSLELRLRHEQPIERIVVMVGQAGDTERMGMRDRQRLDLVLGQLLRHEAIGRRGEDQRPQSDLDGDFPGQIEPLLDFSE
jgi:hypothetical protein